MDFLNKQIDRDIEAQKSRQDQQKTVLGANQALYHDDVLANNATRINMNDIYDHKIQLAAAQLGTPAAKANADAAHSKFALENAALLQNNAMRATALQAMKNGGSGLDPITLGHAGFMPPEQAQKEQASVNQQKNAINNVNNLYQAADKEQSTGNLLNPESSRRMSAINAQMTNIVMENDASKRLTPESAELEVRPFWINTSDNADTRAAKQQGMLNLVKSKHAGETPQTERLAPGAIPNYGLINSSTPTEGATGTDKRTGKPVVFKNGRFEYQ